MRSAQLQMDAPERRFPPTSRIAWRRTCRLVPSRHPTVGLFDRVAAPADLPALIELEGWTNDRVSGELGILKNIPREEWIVGRPMATVIMAPFCHPAPGGGRFSIRDRGAWYAGRTLKAALAESIYHRTKELEEIGMYETRVETRLYHADFTSAFHDVRARERRFAPLYYPDNYGPSQELGQKLFEAGSNGVLYHSVRDPGGECLVCYRPRLVLNVRAAAHYEYRWEGSRVPRVNRLS
jgi:RES domain